MFFNLLIFYFYSKRDCWNYFLVVNSSALVPLELGVSEGFVRIHAVGVVNPVLRWHACTTTSKTYGCELFFESTGDNGMMERQR